mmetsp:Transcript_17218/g.51401  ORF Transcript_17218/g.51401 Transcript_17218/m.51401 type:complete len:192 (+) Transcript_17218:326-901(+)
MHASSVTGLLAEEELVPCEMLIDGPGLGHLDRSGENKSEDLAKGEVAQLPMWLALLLEKKHMVRLKMPAMFGDKVRQDLLAGANTVDLGKGFTKHYFTVGRRLAAATGDDELRKELRQAQCGERYERVFDWSQHSGDRPVGDFRDSLTHEECAIFDAGHGAAGDVGAWKRRKLTQLKTDPVFKRSAPRRVA